MRIRVAHAACEFARPDQPAVFPRQADGRAPGVADRSGDALVDGSGKHHLDDLDRRLVGDSEALLERCFDIEAGEHGADLRPAAMHHYGVDAHLLEQHHIPREGARELRIDHGAAAEFDDEGVARKAPHIGQRL